MIRNSIIAGLLALFLSACGAPDRPSISLYLAVQRGDIDQIERHIYWKTDINTVFPNGYYPIHQAAEKGRIIIIKLLVKNGVEVNQPAQNGRTAIALAILNGRIQAAEILIKAGAQFDASKLLLEAAKIEANDRDVVRFLVKSGADTESTNDIGDTPLLTSIRTANHRLAAHLIEQGAHVNAQDREGRYALSIAEERGAIDIYQTLLRNGATKQPVTASTGSAIFPLRTHND